MTELHLLKIEVEEKLEALRTQYRTMKRETEKRMNLWLQSSDLTDEYKKRNHAYIRVLTAETEILGRGYALIEVLRTINIRMMIEHREGLDGKQISEEGENFLLAKFERTT